jgi:alkanesulfonate monooxygenase SsuD/methylene tetrahydromethanopterin reductase-like flavin-dependent oxidoreductase (luciferase family)
MVRTLAARGGAEAAVENTVGHEMYPEKACMRYGFVIPKGDPRTVAALARELEDAGWDGAFYWDGISLGGEWAGDVYDPWVVMAAMAMRTERVRLGALVTPPSRRRPWKLARETMTLDRLCAGRLIVPVGLGAIDDQGFANVGEATDRKTRAALLDETLQILTGLWGGKPFAFKGEHYQFGEMTFLPTPVQRPRPPLWVVAAWPRQKSMARALRYDGILPNVVGPDGQQSEGTPQRYAEIAAYVAEHRAEPGPFDIVVDGTTPSDDRAAAAAHVRPFAEAGGTWWIESPWTPPNEVDDLRRRIAAGPPRVD